MTEQGFFTEASSAEVVISRNAKAKDARLAEVMAILTKHLHAAVKEIEPTEGEWFEAIKFLTATGHMCTDGGDVLIHEGWGEAYGGAGGDTLIGLNPIFIKQGDPLFDVAGSPLAQKDESLLLDGVDRGDWVLVFGGERATAIGGAGRDWVFNTSVNGIVYGDTHDGLSSSGTAENWEATTTGPDGKLSYTHGDKIWFWGGTTMMDPTKADQLAFIGHPPWHGGNHRLCAGIVSDDVGLR